MNAKVLWYLLKTDWRRLWVAMVALWIVLLFAGLPAATADFTRMAENARWLASGSGGITSLGFQKLVLYSAMPGMEGWADAVAAVSALAMPIFVLACVLIGITGGGWSAARPVRKVEWMTAKFIELVVFVLLPASLLVGLNTLCHGFSSGAAAGDMGRSMLHMLPMTVMLAVSGAMCGTFIRWVGWMAGFALFFFVAGLVLRRSWLDGEVLDMWGGSGDFLLRDTVIIVLLMGVISLRKLRRSNWTVMVAWPLIIAAMLGARWVGPLRLPGQDAPQEIPRLEIAGDRWSVEDFSFKGQTRDRKSLVRVDAGSLGEDGGGDGGKSVWWPEGEISVARDGRHVGGSPALTFSERMEHRRNGVDQMISGLVAPPEDLLRKALPDEAGNLISTGPVSSFPTASLPLGVIGEIPQGIDPGNPVDISARLRGVRIRYALVGELPVGSSLNVAGAAGPIRIDASYAGGVRVHLARLSRTWNMREHRLSEMVVVLMFPRSGVSIRLQPAGALQGADHSPDQQLLAGCRFESAIFQSGNAEFQRMSKLFGPFGQGDVKILVFRKEVLGRMSREIHGSGVTIVVPPVPPEEFRRTLPEGDTRDFFSTYPAGRPDPAVCTEQEAGMWLYRVLALETNDDDWLAREISPYVARNAGLMMRLPAVHFLRKAVGDALVEGLPEGEWRRFSEAMKAEPDDRKFAAMFSIAERRGRMPDIKEAVVGRIGRGGLFPEHLALAAVKYEDRSFYPALLALVGKGVSWELYEKIRPLPGIKGDLDAAVRKYEEVLHEGRGGSAGLWMIPASTGSGRALAAILSILDERAISGKDFHDWRQVLEVAALPVTDEEISRHTVSLRYGGMSVDDFTWSPFLQQWRLKPNFQFRHSR